MQNINEEISTDNHFNVVDILLIDHGYLKECIDVLLDDEADKSEKLFYSRTFLDTLKKHSLAEEKTVYDSLVDMEEFHETILEDQLEHAMAKKKFQSLIPRVQNLKKLDKMTEIEIKVLAKIVKQHIKEEEVNLFPRMRMKIDSGILNEIGFQFLILRKFSPQDLKDYPELQHQLYSANLEYRKNSKRNVYQWSGDFVKKVNRYISSLVGQSQYIKH